MMKTTIYLLGFLGMFLNYSSVRAATIISNVPTVSLTGIDKQIFTSYSGTISNIQLDIGLLGLGSGVVNTGIVTFSLDKDSPASFFEFNYDTGMATATYNLKGESKKLNDLGINSILINLTESGTIQYVEKIEESADHTFQWFDTFKGNFTQIGADVQNYTGKGRGIAVSSYPYSFKIASSTSMIGSFVASSSNMFIGKGTIINQNNANVNIPEPASTFGLIVLGTLGAASTLNRKLKSSQSNEKETTKVS